MTTIKDNSKLFILVYDSETSTRRWEEVKEANFGSVSKPNKKILAFRLEPPPKKFKDIFDFFNQ